MSDAMSHGAAAHDRARTRAYAKYGTLTKDQICEIGEALSAQIKAARVKCEDAQRELDALERENEDLWIVFVDDLNGRRQESNT
jgi:flagellar biosynthesis regulator FlaF